MNKKEWEKALEVTVLRRKRARARASRAGALEAVQEGGRKPTSSELDEYMQVAKLIGKNLDGNKDKEERLMGFMRSLSSNMERHGTLLLKAYNHVNHALVGLQHGSQASARNDMRSAIAEIVRYRRSAGEATTREARFAWISYGPKIDSYKADLGNWMFIIKRVGNKLQGTATSPGGKVKQFRGNDVEKLKSDIERWYASSSKRFESVQERAVDPQAYTYMEWAVKYGQQNDPDAAIGMIRAVSQWTKGAKLPTEFDSYLNKAYNSFRSGSTRAGTLQAKRALQVLKGVM